MAAGSKIICILNGRTCDLSIFAAGNMRAWGVGILPLGWAKFISLPADEMADRFCDGAAHPAFAAFAPLLENLGRVNDVDAAAAMIDGHLCTLLPGAAPDDPVILAAHPDFHVRQSFALTLKRNTP